MAAAWLTLLLVSPGAPTLSTSARLFQAEAKSAANAAGHARSAERVLRDAAPLGGVGLFALDTIDSLDLEEEEEELANGLATTRLNVSATPRFPGRRPPAGVLEAIPARPERSEPEARAPPFC